MNEFVCVFSPRLPALLELLALVFFARNDPHPTTTGTAGSSHLIPSSIIFQSNFHPLACTSVYSKQYEVEKFQIVRLHIPRFELKRGDQKISTEPPGQPGL